MSNGREAVSGSGFTLRALIPTNGRRVRILPSSPPTTNILFWRPLAISSKANPIACALLAHAEANPQLAPFILYAETRLKESVPTIEQTIANGKQRRGPTLSIFCMWW